jgi:hypothetical protein
MAATQSVPVTTGARLLRFCRFPHGRHCPSRQDGGRHVTVDGRGQHRAVLTLPRLKTVGFLVQRFDLRWCRVRRQCRGRISPNVTSRMPCGTECFQSPFQLGVSPDERAEGQQRNELHHAGTYTNFCFHGDPAKPALRWKEDKSWHQERSSSGVQRVYPAGQVGGMFQSFPDSWNHRATWWRDFCRTCWQTAVRTAGCVRSSGRKEPCRVMASMFARPSSSSGLVMCSCTGGPARARVISAV